MTNVDQTPNNQTPTYILSRYGSSLIACKNAAATISTKGFGVMSQCEFGRSVPNLYSRPKLVARVGFRPDGLAGAEAGILF